MTPLEYFRVIAKQFASVDDATVTVWLDISSLNANTLCLEGDRKNLALAYYAAHLLELDGDNQSGNGGRADVKSEREGDLSRTYGKSVGEGTLLGSTGYGQIFVDMVSGCIGSGIMTRFGSELPRPIAPYADDVWAPTVPRNLYD